MDVPVEAREIIRAQWGLATRRQLLEAGVSLSALRWAVSRTWDVVLPGVVHVDRSPLRSSQRQLAALLYAGGAATLSGATAARWYGVTSAGDGGIVRVVVPGTLRGRRVRWVEVRRTALPEVVPTVSGPLLFVSAARAVVDAARSAPDDDATRSIVIESVQRGIVALDRLAHENDRLGTRGAARVRRAIDEAAVGAWSVPEADLVALVRRSAVLPTMTCNPELATADGRRLISPDGWFDDVAMAVMVHSAAHHSIGQDWERTVQRDAEMRAVGITVVAITPRALRRTPGDVLRLLEETYLSAKALSRRPAVIARPRFGLRLS